MNHEESKRKKPEGENAAPSADRDLGQSVSTTPEDLRRRRDQRIQDHLGIVLDSSDTLQACMGPILCDILGICQEMKRLLGERISRSPSPTAEVKEFMPLMEMYLKTVRQAERLANVDCRIRESRICRPEE
jgi:hypothetical protein